MDNAVPEYKQLLNTTEDPNAIQEASNQLSSIVREQIKHSLADMNYGRATEEIGVMREELTALEEPGIYNEFITQLRTDLLEGNLGGDRKDMWNEIRKNRLGLITKGLSNLSNVTEEEARAVSLHTSE